MFPGSVLSYKDVKEWIQSCEACQDLEQTQRKETFMSHEVPERAWENFGCNLYSYHSKDYLITVCYMFNFREFDRYQVQNYN